MANMTTTEILTGIKNWVLGKIGNITALIPSEASSSNKLADKAFVNSSIATATATFRGTYNLVTDLSLTTDATQQQIVAALATKMSALSIVPDNNDYSFVQIPTDDATPTEIARVDRYKYNGSAWLLEYTVNNSGFTAAQWATLNSGLVSGDKTKLDALPTSAELTTLLNGKEVVTNKVTSISGESTDTQYPSAKAVWTAITAWLSGAMSWTAAQMKQARANLGFGNGDIDDVPTASSNNVVKSGGVQNELALGAVYDVTAKNPTAGANNDGKWASLSALLSDANLNTLIPSAVRKGGMSIKFVCSYDNKYVQYRLMATSFSTTVTDWQGVDDEPTAGSNNLVKSGGVHEILNGSTETHYTEGGYIKTDGTVASNENYSYSEYIPISAGQNIHLDYGTIAINLVVVVYNAERSKVDYWSLTTSSTTKDFTAPANSAYMRFAWTKGYNAKAYSNDVLFWQATVHIDGISDRIDALEDSVETIEDRLDDVSSGLTALEGKVDDIAVDSATVDYGLLAGYVANRTSGADITVTDTATGVHLSKSESSNANYRFDLTAPNGLLKIKYKSNKVLPSSVAIYVDDASVYSESIPDNTKEYEFTYNFASGIKLALGYTMYYDISSVDLDIVVNDINASGLKVIADNLSNRVEDIEENIGTPIPHIISDENTFVGDGAGINNQRSPDSDSGRYNTALGKNAFRYNTSGDHSTAIGFCALNKNTTGRNNTAVGEDALYENISGSQNVGIGQHSGQDNTTGGYNVFIGSNAARRIASGNLNVVVGAEACHTNTDPTTSMNRCIMIGAYVPNQGNYDDVINIGGATPSAANQIIIGKISHTSVIIAGKRINFNQDGTVTWEEISS